MILAHSKVSEELLSAVPLQVEVEVEVLLLL